jgi:hypothetical protein
MHGTRIRTVLVTASAVVMTVALAGCGSSAQSDPGKDIDDRKDDSKPLTAAQFRTQAQKICRDSQAEMEKLGEDFESTQPTQEQFEKAFARIPDLLDQQVDKLEALEPPAEMADDVDAMLDSLSDVAADIDKQGADILTQEADPFAEANEKAKALKLDDCAD